MFQSLVQESSTPAVLMSEVAFSYTSSEPVLQNVNLEIKSGDFVGVLGPNGGGKTTLLRLMLGLLKPTHGRVKIFGLLPEQAREHIGYVPQFSTINSDFPASVIEVVLMGGATRSLFYGTRWNTGKNSRLKATELLHKVGLQGFDKTPVHQLSGGQRQRVLIARALMGYSDDSSKPYMLLLDEPTANIDPQGRFCFYEFLRDMQKELCIVVVSHDLALTAHMFDSVVLVNREVKSLTEAENNPESLNGFFGYHDKSCPMSTFLNTALETAGTANIEKWQEHGKVK